MIDPNDPRLTSYVLGELSASEAAEIEQAMQNSPELEAAVEEICSTVGLLGDAYLGEEKLSLRDEQKVSLKEKQSVTASSHRRWWAIAVAVSLASVLLGVIINGGYFKNEKMRSNPAVARFEPVEGSWTFNIPSDERQENNDEEFEGRLALEVEPLGGEVAMGNSADLEGIVLANSEDWLSKKATRSNYQNIRLREQAVASDESDQREAMQSQEDFEVLGRASDPASDSWRDHGTESGKIESFATNLSVIVDSSDSLAAPGGGRININTMDGEQGLSLLSEAFSSHDRQLTDLPDQEREIPASEPALKIAAFTHSDTQRTSRSSEEIPDDLLSDIDGQKSGQQQQTGEQSAERIWELKQQGELIQMRDTDPKFAQVTGLRMKLLEAQANAELVRQKVGTGHPDYELATAERQVLEAKLETQEQLAGEREKVSRAQQLANLNSQARKLSEGIESIQTVSDKNRNLLISAKQAQAAELLRQIDLIGSISEKEDESIAQTISALQSLGREIKKMEAAAAEPKSWKRVKAIPNTTCLMVGDKEELSLTGMQVNAQVDGFRARVLVDYFYYNDRERQLEGNFKLRLPDDASLYYFAFGESAYEYSAKGKLADDEFLRDGTQFVSLGAQDIKRARKGQWDNVKEARMVPREKAAHAFRETVRRRVDPALVEWSGAGVFSAKVFPLAPKKLHRIVVGYDVNLKRSADGLNFKLSLPEQTGECRIELNVQELEGVSYSITPEVDPIPSEIDGKLQKRFVFETGGAQDFSNIQLSATGLHGAVLRSTNEEGEFWTAQATPDLPIEEGSANSRAIFMVDTSLSSSPDKFNVWLNLLESTLNNNRDSLKEFDVMFFNVDSHFWKGKYVANTPKNVAELKTSLENLALEGATDLYGAVQAVAEAKWVGHEDNRPDLFLLSDGAATWGETDLRLIDRILKQPQLGSLFAYQTGLTGTAISGLRFLAGQSGGAVFSVASEDEIKTASMAHRKRPWQLISIDAEGASDILTAGRIQWVYPGQTITVVGRGTVGENIKLEFQQSNETKTVTLTPTTIESELASRMYGQVSVGQLESLGSQVFDVSAAYARHFRVTGKTCSLLMLESEEDYQRFDIKPEEDLFVVKAKATSALVSETLSKFSQQLADPKAKLQAWLNRLESMPGMEFKMPTALKLAMDDIKIEAISQPLNCTLTNKDGLSDSYLKSIANEQLDYDPISAEANRRAGLSVDDAIKVYSSLVERNPSDIIVARDIAFTAMELDRPAQAFHLLRRVARARPFQGNIYPAIGQCLTQLGKADMAIVYYEIAMNGTFQRQGSEFKQIVAAEYIHLLRQIVSDKLESSVKDFAAARLETLGKHLPFGTADVVITMMWNQDQTDVDLHVVEPSGEECFYSHKTTRSGGQITSDITTGFGPEMYYNANAPRGKYQLKAKYFGSGQNRTSTRNKVYLTVIRGFGSDSETITRRTIQLSIVGEIEPVMTLGIE